MIKQVNSRRSFLLRKSTLGFGALQGYGLPYNLAQAQKMRCIPPNRRQVDQGLYTGPNRLSRSNLRLVGLQAPCVIGRGCGIETNLTPSWAIDPTSVVRSYIIQYYPGSESKPT